MRLLACDFDGTLFRGHTISREDMDAVARWRAHGNLFGIVTGRGARTLLADLPKFDLGCDFLLCNNGALLLDGEGKYLASVDLGAGLGEALLSHEAVDACTSLALFSGLDMRVLEGRAPWINPVYNPPFVSRESALRSSLLQVSFGFADRSLSLVWGERLSREFAGLAKVQCSLSVADVTAPDAGKARGVTWAMEVLGRDPSHIVCVGDDGNDVEMLDAFTGYAIEGAPREVVAAAGRVAKSVAAVVEELEA